MLVLHPPKDIDVYLCNLLSIPIVYSSHSIWNLYLVLSMLHLYLVAACYYGVRKMGGSYQNCCYCFIIYTPASGFTLYRLSWFGLLLLWWNTVTKSKLGRKGFICLTNSPSLKEVRTGIQTGSEPGVRSWYRGHRGMLLTQNPGAPALGWHHLQ